MYRGRSGDNMNACTGNDDFFQNDVRTKKGLDEHGCLGDIGW